jgi:hypothetical protein
MQAVRHGKRSCLFYRGTEKNLTDHEAEQAAVQKRFRQNENN